MKTEKLTKKYPYKKTKAKIIKIETIREESGYYTDYDIDDARYDLDKRKYWHDSSSFSHTCWGNDRYDKYDLYDQVHRYADRNLGYVYDDIFGNPVAKVYQTWYTYRLLLEFTDLHGEKFSVQVCKETKEKYDVGDIIIAYYKIDNPNIVKFDSLNSIDDYYKNLRFMIACFVLIAVGIIIPTIIAKFKGYI